jgi:predicted glutamine amidotransferase
MCICILNTKKAGALTASELKNSWDNNNMGAGLLWVENNRLNVFKSYDYGTFTDMYYEIRERNKVGNIVLHYRISTSGFKGEHNLHPFLVNDKLGFVHNGVISGLGNKDFSDTYEFNDMLKKFKHDFLKCEMTRYLISKHIGYSKLVFLDINDKYTIINEEDGHWKNDNWYSNTSYESYNDYVWAGNTKVYKNKNKDKTQYKESVPYTYENIGDDKFDEYDVYLDLCDMYAMDAEEDETFLFIEEQMFINGCETLGDLWDLFYNYNPHTHDMF